DKFREAYHLDAASPFGLTYDIVANAMVAETAIVVNPPDETRDWQLACARMRRLILPETLLDSALPRNQAPKAPPVQPKPLGWSLPVRTEGSDRVPIDFCMDVPAGQWPQSVTIKAGSQDLPLEYPKEIEGAQRRLLVSWHKQRWEDGGDAKWRAQVLAQQR